MRLLGTVTGFASRLVFDLGFLKLWKAVPPNIRRRVVHAMVRLPKRKGAVPETIAPPCHVVGLASSHASLGWATRAAVLTLQNEGMDPWIWNVADRFGTDHMGQGPGKRPEGLVEEQVGAPGTLILCVNPNQIAFSLAALPKALVRNKRIIGYFVWELEHLPEAWLAPSAFVDEVWAPSQFVADAFSRTYPDKPVRVVPYALTVPEGIVSDRSAFGLPDGHCVLVAANLQSGTERKNVVAAIEAFQRAFRGDPGATLVLKLHDGDRMPERQAALYEALSETRHTLITQDLDDRDMWRLIASCDTIFSMHRSEGYGLLMRQGLMLNKNVIATGWSGNVDFMADDPNAHFVRYTLVPVRDPENIYSDRNGERWADPDIDHAVELLRQAASTSAPKAGP